jgi:LPS-assembly protein
VTLRSILAIVAGASALTFPARAYAQPDEAFKACKELRRFQERLVFNEPVPERPEVKWSLLAGSVEIQCDDTFIFADEVEWFSDQDIVHVRGNLLFIQGDLRIFATRAEINRRTKYGTFYEFSGSARLGDTPAERSQFGTQEPEVRFEGERLERIGPRRFRLTSGSFTTCVQATPRWHMTGTGGTFTLDENVVLRNAVLKVKDVPVFYVPVIYYPINKEDRATGFLLPTYSTSSYRGTGLSNAFFWAMGRSQDATFYYDWFSKAGQGVGAEYRFATAPGAGGQARVYVLNEKARLAEAGVAPQAAQRSFTVDATVNQSLGRRFRLGARVDYFSRAATQQLYQQNVYDFSQRTRDVSVSFGGGLGRYRLSADFQQRDFYYDLTHAQRSGRAPAVSLAMAEKPIGRSRIYFGASGSAAYLRREDDILRPETDSSLVRFDGAPTVRIALSSLPFLTATTSASWRVTHWLESIDPQNRVQVPVRLTRQIVDVQATVTGPLIARVWQKPDSGYADRIKHLIEPSVTVQWVSPFDELTKVVQQDGVDSIVGGNMTLTYRLTNRVLARRKTASGPGVTRQIVSVSLYQSRYTNLLAAAYDPQYQAVAVNPSTFSPLVLAVDVQPAEGVTARFQTDFDARMRAVRTLAASGSVARQVAQVTATWAKRQFIPGLPGFDNPAYADHTLGVNTTVNDRQKRVGGTYAINLDIFRTTLLQQRVVAFYNTQCCGISVDYQVVRFAFGNVPADRRFGLSFTLAGIGSFSNPLGSFGR